MAVKPLIQFPIFAPPNPPSPRFRPATEIRFSRWNNANAEEFIRRERTQKELEDQIRFEKRFDTALNLAHNYSPAPPHLTTFKSTGTPSQPSQPSIPGKFSKYSKIFTKNLSHPAFRPVIRPRKIPKKEEDSSIDEPEARNEGSITSTTATVKVDKSGVAYEVPDAPFLYQYSYTETPKVKPVKIREPLVSPFGPDTMGRPWTGRKPLPPSKKKLPEFDSFRLPPPHKKGVKPVQAPGPFLEGSGPRYVKSREEILGEPLTKEEVEELIRSCRNSPRQLNIGRDGLTHNMLENIHAHWKRRRVCKIKCKGVCTVDMVNVRQQLEEKTGGKIIYCKGGVIYLFRGRNYNYKTRPRFPLMLWRPVSPVYPRLIKRVPDGLTLEEATEMRKKGRNLIPICKLAKNGVYCDLAKNVREAFEACELVRINCEILNGSDFRKIGAKLKDLVPCVLISFENEHILMWRGRDWKSSLPEVKDVTAGAGDPSIVDVASNSQTIDADTESTSISGNPMVSDEISGDLNSSTYHGDYEATESGDLSVNDAASNSQTFEENSESSLSDSATVTDAFFGDTNTSTSSGDDEAMESETCNGLSKEEDDSFSFEENDAAAVASLIVALPGSSKCRDISDGFGACNNEPKALSAAYMARPGYSSANDTQNSPSSEVPSTGGKLHDTQGAPASTCEVVTMSVPCTEEVLLLRKAAVENGSAIMLESSDLDADNVHQKAISLAKSAPPGPVFRRRPRQSKTSVGIKEKDVESEIEETITVSVKEGGDVSGRKVGERKSSKGKSMKGIKEEYSNVVPQGSLRVDELAKLLS